MVVLFQFDGCYFGLLVMFLGVLFNCFLFPMVCLCLVLVVGLWCFGGFVGVLHVCCRYVLVSRLICYLVAFARFGFEVLTLGC